MASATRAAGAKRADFTRWVSQLQRKQSTASATLSAASLERQVMSLAARNPEYIVVGAN